MERSQAENVKTDLRTGRTRYASRALGMEAVRLLLESKNLTLKETEKGFIVTVEKDESMKASDP